MSELRAWILLGVTTLLLVVSVAFFIHVVSSRMDGRRAEAVPGDALYREVMSRIDHDYVTEVDHEKLVYAAVKSLVGELDPHSRLYVPGEWEDFQQETRGEMLGIGVDMSAIGEALVIGYVVPGSPAAEVGLRAGERLVTIAGKPVDAAKRFDEAARDLRGPAGTRVAVTVAARNGGSPRDVTIRRDTFDTPTVHARMLPGEDGVAHVRITAFRTNTAQAFNRSIADLRRRGLKRLVLDLRFNRGGTFDSAVEIADEWITDGVIVRTRGRARYSENRATPAAPLHELPTVVLVNNQTASAAEILTGALQDMHVAAIAGERTYGKGVVQEVQAFQSWAGGMKITTAHYYTPAERCIERQVAPRPDRQETYGILPDVVVRVDDAARERITRAIEVLHYDPEVRREVLARASLTGEPSEDPQLSAGLHLLHGEVVDTSVAKR